MLNNDTSKQASQVTDDHGRLLLTEEEWMVQMKINDNGDGWSSDKSGGKKNHNGKDGSKAARSVVKCTNYDKKGQEAKVCQSKPKRA
jgi:hypothetical protein